MSWFLYQLGYALLLVLAAPFLLARRGRHYLQTIPARLGRKQAPGSPFTADLWVHAVSVGEVAVATAFLSRLPDHFSVVLTTITPSGQEQARRLLGNRVVVSYLPMDLGFAVSRFLRQFSPRALILVEGDLWPLVLRAAKQQRLPILVINGRISDRGFGRLQRLARWARPLLSPVDFFAMQSEKDRQRLLDLGVEKSKIEVTGNLKFDIPPPVRHRALESDILALAAGRPILIAGSTMDGEETLVLDAHRRLSATHDTLLVLAPRHPERWPKVAEELTEDATPFVRRSALPPTNPAAPTVSVVLLDSLGELAGLYAIAEMAFVGGTLVDTGGHNPLEPSRFATPTAVGPSMYNFPDIAALYDRAEGWSRVSDAAALAGCWQRWIEKPERARRIGEAGAAIFAANQGALEATVGIVSRFVPGLRP